MRDNLARLVEEYDREEGAIVGLLQDVQEAEGYLPRDMLEDISRQLDVPLIRLYALATFYRAFSLVPKGRHCVTCCMGTACHVRGAPRVVQALERDLGVRAGETTPDLGVSLDTVNCVGACALGPLVIIDGRYHGGMTPTKAQRLVQKLRGGVDADGSADSA